MVGADTGEAEGAPEDYRSLSAFFVRRLRKDVREWPADPRVVASPVDGILGRMGALENGVAIQAKGISYEVAELLGEPADQCVFRSGVFVTMYLSPRHYHGVHSPCAVRLTGARALSGSLFPVHPGVARLLPGLFTRNERMITRLDSDDLDLAVVAVGALNVGSISADFDPSWTGGDLRGVTNRGPARSVVRRYEPPLDLSPGDPLMTFHLGSTVVVLLRPKDGSTAALHESLREGSEIRLGKPLLRTPELSSPGS